MAKEIITFEGEPFVKSFIKIRFLHFFNFNSSDGTIKMQGNQWKKILLYMERLLFGLKTY